MVNLIKNEFWKGYNWFERIFLYSMVLLQIIVYCFVPDTPIGIVCGIAGCICVALTAKGKISSYGFNFLQMITYMVICWNAALYFEFAEQVFYFIVCVFGVVLWKRNMKQNTDGTTQVITKKFKIWHWIIVIVVTALTTVGLGVFGTYVLGGTLPYLDAFTVSLAIIAQFLMVWRFREQWIIWVVIDVASLVMFIQLANWSMVAMYIAWTINAFYGWYNWTKLAKN